MSNPAPEGYQEIHEEYDTLTTEHLELVKQRIIEALIDARFKYDLVVKLLGERALK